MEAVTLGKIVVPTPGTPVQVRAGYLGVSKIRFEAPLSNTHVAWIGIAGLVGSTLTKVIKQLQFPAAGAIPDAFEIESQDEANDLNLNDYFVDATTAGEGALVTYWQR